MCIAIAHKHSSHSSSSSNYAIIRSKNGLRNEKWFNQFFYSTCRELAYASHKIDELVEIICSFCIKRARPLNLWHRAVIEVHARAHKCLIICSLLRNCFTSASFLAAAINMFWWFAIPVPTSSCWFHRSKVHPYACLPIHIFLKCKKFKWILIRKKFTNIQCSASLNNLLLHLRIQTKSLYATSELFLSVTHQMVILIV